MYNGQLPYLKSHFITRKFFSQDENAADNKLPLLSNRDKISFRCLNDFIQIQIHNSRNKPQGSINKYESFTLDHSNVAEAKTRNLNNILNIIDPQTDGSTVIMESDRFLSDLN